VEAGTGIEPAGAVGAGQPAEQLVMITSLVLVTVSSEAGAGACDSGADVC
jgi:hypothetical protein